MKRNLPRLRRLDGFKQKILHVPHEHVAACFRWTIPRVSRRSVMRHLDEPYPYVVLERLFVEGKVAEVEGKLRYAVQETPMRRGAHAVRRSPRPPW